MAGHRTLSRRGLSLLVTLTLSALSLATCADDEGEDPSGDGGRIEGGSLTVQTLEPASLDPHFSSFAQDGSIQRMLWRGLYRLDKDATPQPMMARDPPQISDDGLLYSVRLMEGLSWSDGDGLTSEDFVAGLLRSCNPVNAAAFQYLLSNLEGCDEHFESGEYDSALEGQIGVRAIDEVTLELQLKNPQPTFTHVLSLAISFPSPVHLLPNSSDPWPDADSEAPGKLVYNGPYILTEYSPGDHATLAPNPHWAGEVRPTLDTVNLRFIDDLSAATNAYRTGELDSTTVNLTQLSTIVNSFGEGDQYFRGATYGTYGLLMQMQHEALGDAATGRDLRLALGRAIDRDALNRICYEGGHIPTTTWIPESSGAQAPDTFVDEIGYDPAKATVHLSEAGYGPEGELPELTVLVPPVPEFRCFGEFVQESWRDAIGLRVAIEEVDAATLSSRIADGNFELALVGWIPDYPDPESWILGAFPSSGSYNSHHCSMPEIDERAEQARYNQDDAARRRLYREIDELAVTNVCGVFVLFHFGSHYLIKPDVVGMRENISVQDLSVAGDWDAEAWGRSE